MLATFLAFFLLFQTSSDMTPLANKTVEGSDPQCSMTDLHSELVNERALVCPVPQESFFAGEVRLVKAGIAPFILGGDDEQRMYELSSCACAQNPTWTRTMGLVSTASSSSVKWTWKLYTRKADCSLELKKNEVKYGCTTELASGCACPEGWSCGIGRIDSCVPWSPVVIDLEGDGIRFSSRANGVMFDLNSNGETGLMPWTNDAWLVLLDEGGVRDGGAMFGDHSPQPWLRFGEQPSGYSALRVFDDDHDGVITASDGVWGLLGVWRDVNWNGIAEQDEIASLSSVMITAIDLDYRESRRIDQYGNEFRYRARVTVNGKTRWSYDVFPSGD